MAHSASSRHPGVVTGLFPDRESAERGYRAAAELGYDRDQINLILSDETRDRYFGGDSTSRAQAPTALAGKAAEPAPEASERAEHLGGPVGGTAGIIAPVLGVVGTLLLVPGLVFAGPIAAALTAAGAVGVVGGLVGALTDWGIPEERIEQYEAGIRRGGILIGVEPRSEEHARRLEHAWRDAGGQLVHS